MKNRIKKRTTQPQKVYGTNEVFDITSKEFYEKYWEVKDADGNIVPKRPLSEFDIKLMEAFDSGIDVRLLHGNRLIIKKNDADKMLEHLRSFLSNPDKQISIIKQSTKP